MKISPYKTSDCSFWLNGSNGIVRHKFICLKFKWLRNPSAGKQYKVCFCDNPCSTSKCGSMFYVYLEKNLRLTPVRYGDQTSGTEYTGPDSSSNNPSTISKIIFAFSAGSPKTINYTCRFIFLPVFNSWLLLSLLIKLVVINISVVWIRSLLGFLFAIF